MEQVRHSETRHQAASSPIQGLGTLDSSAVSCLYWLGLVIALSALVSVAMKSHHQAA